MTNNYYSYIKKSTNIFRLIQCLFLPIAILSKIIIKNKEISIYGSMSGFDISDNSLYHYLLNKSKKKFFITKNPKNLKIKKNYQVNILYCYSLKGIFVQLIASKAFYTHSIYDFSPCLVYGSKIINLWHGVPIYKKKYPPKNKLSTLIYFIAPYVNPFYFDYVYLSQVSEIDNYKKLFRVSENKIIIKPQARNSFFGKKIKSIFLKNINILYCPTSHYKYRKCNLSPNYFIGFILDIEKKLNSLQKKKLFNIVFKPHPIDIDYIFKDYYHEKIIYDDLYESMNSFDLIITDFSSIYFDCIERKIPCFIFSKNLDFFQYDDRYELSDILKENIISDDDVLIKKIFEELKN